MASIVVTVPDFLQMRFAIWRVFTAPCALGDAPGAPATGSPSQLPAGPSEGRWPDNCRWMLNFPRVVNY